MRFVIIYMNNIHIILLGDVFISALLAAPVYLPYCSRTSFSDHPPSHSLKALDQVLSSIKDNILEMQASKQFIFPISNHDFSIIIAIRGIANFKKNQKQINSKVTQINTI